MQALARFFRKLSLLVRREQFQRGLDEEMAFHREQVERDLESEGMAGEAARFAARRQFGNDTRVKEQSHEVVGFWFESLVQDIRFALRQLRKNPGFAGTAILVLTLGISVSVAFFAFVDAALIRPLPYRQPGRMAILYESIPLGPRFHLSYPDYLDWKRLNKVFSSLDVYENFGFMLSTPSGAQQAEGARVSDGFFRTLGVTPVLGRDFRIGEGEPSQPRVVLLSYGAWQKRYGGRREVVGQTVTLDGTPNTIVGVLPRDFHFAPAEPADFWSTMVAGDRNCRGCHSFYGVARLKDGVSFATAFADIKAIARQLELKYPDSNRDQAAFMLPLPEVILGDIRPILLVLLSGAGLLLLIACVNVASLLLVRAESRRREMAVRGALGASPARLVRQLISEGFVLVTISSLLGIAAADWGMRLVTRLVPKDVLAGMPYLHSLSLGPRVIAFAIAISCAAALLFSLTPALRLQFSEVRADLAEGGRGYAGTVWRKLGTNLVIVELATAMLLLTGAGLLTRSFYRLLNVDTGMRTDHLAMLQIAAPLSTYSKPEKSTALEKQVVAQIGKLPGVSSVGISNQLPLGDADGTTQFVIVGRPYHGEHNEVTHRSVSSAYFSTLQARLLAGRLFTEADDHSTAHVAIINRFMANQYFRGENPIGMRINYNGAPATSITQIVGVIDDVREGQLDFQGRATWYVPFYQNPGPFFAAMVRTSQDPHELIPALTKVVQQIDPDVATFGGITMEDRIHDSQAAYLHRSSAWLVSCFAGLALILGVVGLYGVIAYSVSQRTREIGVRMALGAQRGSVYRLILKEASWLVAIGITAGLLCSLAATSLMRKLLFGISPWDASTLATVAAALAVAALAASYLPARRAASVNPVEALRAE